MNPVRDRDLSPAEPPLPRNSLRQSGAATPHCGRLSCNACTEERTGTRDNISGCTGKMQRLSEGPRGPSSTHILALDGLRGVAILLVLLHHLRWFLNAHVPAEFATMFALNIGWCGVVLFFVLSGFLITGILLDSRDSTNYFRVFYARRFLRIFPLYYAYLALVFAGSRLIREFFGAPDVLAPIHAAWYLAYMQNFRPNTMLSDPLLGHLWSLAVEEQFYLVWPLFVLFLRPRVLSWVSLSAIPLSLAIRLHYAGRSPELTAFVNTFTPASLDALASGALISLIMRDPVWRRRAHMAVWPFAIGCCVWFALVAWRAGGVFEYQLPVQTWGTTALTLLFASMVFLAATGGARVLEWRPLRLTGKISYGLYVLHPAVIAALTPIFAAVPTSPSLDFIWNAEKMFATLAVSYAVAAASWVCFEGPILRLKKHFQYSRRKDAFGDKADSDEVDASRLTRMGPETQTATSLSVLSVEKKPARTEAAFWPVLLALTAAGLLIRIYVARTTYIDFDEWQHLFMAGAPRWADFLYELRMNSHPPLFFLLLRGIIRLGNTALYRLIPVAAGTGSIVVVGLIARRILRSPEIQLLCAASFSLSSAAIAVSAEIRSYQLATILMLLAFWAWLSIFPDSKEKRSSGSALFGVCASLAILSHYSAVFFLGACTGVPLIMAATVPELRRQWLSPLHRNSMARAGLAIAVPWSVFAFLYFAHIRKQLLQGYAPEFYGGGTPGETPLRFIMRNGQNFFNLFSPIELHSAAAFATVIAAGALMVFLYIRKSRWTDRGAASVSVAIFVVALMVIASLARKYPFGGLLRHQYVAAPFLLIACFVLVDAFLRAARPFVKRAILVGGITLAAVNLVARLPNVIAYPGAVILKGEYQVWRSNFATTRAVYVDHWGAIGFFIHTSSVPRGFVQRIRSNVHIDEYGLPDGTRIFYDRTRDNLDLTDTAVYRSFADCLRESGVRELSLFFFVAETSKLPRLAAERDQLIAEKAATQGLIVTRVVAVNNSVFAGFRLAGR